MAQRIFGVSRSQALAWVLTAIILPSGTYAAKSIISKLDAIQSSDASQTQLQAIQAVDIKALKAQFGDFQQSVKDLRREDADDVSDLRSDVKALTRETQRLAIAVERLMVEHEIARRAGD